MLSISRTSGVAVLILASSTSYCLVWLYRRHRYLTRYNRCPGNYKQVPRTWKQVGRIAEIVLFPLKSAYRLSVQEAFCDDKGLRMLAADYPLSDRCFVLFNRNKKKYISNHFYAHLSQVKVTVINDFQIEFTVHNNSNVPALLLNMKQINESSSRAVHTIRMYEKDQVHALDCGDEASNWFSTFLTGSADANIRLGYDCDEQRRLNDTIYEDYRHFYGAHITNQDMGKFSYLASYMVMNETSVEDLNERLKEKGESPVSIHNFRGNLIIRTEAAYEEDSWPWLRLSNDVTLRVMKPCTRCKMTCLDADTAQRNSRLEPLETLRSYRAPYSRKLEGKSPRLGLYCGLYARGLVKVGDPVYVAADEE